MSDLHSPSWYRVAQLRPRLRGHVRIHRHHYRGELWYVLEDRVSRRMHRFNRIAYYVIGLLDGRRTVQEIWDGATERFGDDAPTQDEVIRLLGRLHAAEVLQTEAMPDVAELARRTRRGRKKTWIQNLASPLAIRIPLFDPDRALERWLPWYGPWFGWIGAIVWCAVMITGIVQAGAHWAELSADVTSRVLAPQNLLVLLLTFPVIKLLHEFGHACAVKAWGGEVHEMGIMLLVLMPIPYVDASAASAFPEARRRVFVGLAGMVIELFVAAVALFFWIAMEPGLARAVLYDVMLIAGISTVLFNANPLLRYDGYYILADLVQIPNLRTQANQYLGRLVETRLFGVQDNEAEPPDGRAWLAFYAVTSFLYRTFVICVIALFVASEYLIVGVLLALWALATAVVLPLAKGIGYLLMHQRLRRRRPRALAVTALAGAALYWALFVLPVPLWTQAEGIVALPEESFVRAGTDGFVKALPVEHGAQVRAGAPLITTEEPTLQLRARVLQAEIRLLEARASALRLENRVRWLRTLDELDAARGEMRQIQERVEQLTIVSPVAGAFVPMQATVDLPGRFLRQGEHIGYVLPAKTASALVLVSQDDVDLVRNRVQRIEVKVASRVYESYAATLRREVPAASDRLVNLALSSAGGGRAALDPRQTKEPKTLESWFAFELDLPQTRALALGEHVYVRFEHGAEPLATRLYRSVRQLFMRQFTV